jgi:hypothetical protein
MKTIYMKSGNTQTCSDNEAADIVSNRLGSYEPPKPEQKFIIVEKWKPYRDD